MSYISAVLANGAEYFTFEPGQPIEVGYIVKLPDGRAAEVTEPPDVLTGWLSARPWDAAADRDYHVSAIAPWLDPEATQLEVSE